MILQPGPRLRIELLLRLIRQAEQPNGFFAVVLRQREFTLAEQQHRLRRVVAARSY